MLRCGAFAGIDRTAIVDVCAHAAATPCVVCWVGGRAVIGALRCGGRCLRRLGGFGWCCCRRGGGAAPRRGRIVMTPQGVVVLVPDASESELSDAGIRCSAVLVGLDSGGGMEAFAANGCHKPCLGDPVTRRRGRRGVRRAAPGRRMSLADQAMHASPAVVPGPQLWAPPRRTEGAHAGVASCKRHLEMHHGPVLGEASDAAPRPAERAATPERSPPAGVQDPPEPAPLRPGQGPAG